MNVTAVDHVEFYVSDADSTAQYLRQAFGFRRLGRGGPETGLPGQRSLLLGQADIRLLVSSALTVDHPIAQYVERHGDAAACVGLRTGDAAAAYEMAVAAGAEPVSPPRRWRHGDSEVIEATVAGPGPFRHRLIQRDTADGEFLPGGITMLSTEPTGDRERLETIDHIALCVGAGELEPAVRYYRDTFGLAEIFEERVEVGDQAMDSKVVQSESRLVTFTIVSPDPATRGGQLNEFLAANHGAGVQHLALSTQDIVAAVHACRDRGVRFLSTPDSYYDAIGERLARTSLPVAAIREANILVDRDHWGEMFQIFTESPFQRRTFFMELIERHGALTFGSNNIRALYEAKARVRDTAEASA